ncbi:MAG: hypothetical protein PHD54_03870 [Desulfuromonadaceae bacterium]|nr:hypothetical protein [Desulfuromonadaceae bacterium]
MNFDRNIAAILLAPLIGLALPATVFFWKMPKSALTRTESELMNFSSQPLLVSRPGVPPMYSGVENPINPPKPKQTTQTMKTPALSFPPGPIPAAAGARRSVNELSPLHVPNVSMIYDNGGSKMAIIDGHVLHEGSVFAGHTIVKIYTTKVLARTNGKEIWLSIE